MFEISVRSNSHFFGELPLKKIKIKLITFKDFIFQKRLPLDGGAFKIQFSLDSLQQFKIIFSIFAA